MERTKFIILVIVILLLVSGVLWWWGASRHGTPNPEDLQEVTGVITAINSEDQSFTLSQVVLVEENDTFSTKETVYTVRWDEHTTFIFFRDAAALSANEGIAVGAEELQREKNVIIKTEDDGTKLDAFEVHILPGSSAS